MKWTRTLVITYINIVLYALCYQFQRPIEPFLVEKLGGKDQDAKQAYGQVQSFYSIIQTIGSPVMGVVCDHLGAKKGFILVFAGSALSYGMLAYATTMTMLFASKIPAMFQHAFLCAQTLVAVSVEGTDRAEALGLLMTAYTIGATIGPFVGGLVGASGDYYLGAKLATAGSLLSIVLSLLIPEPDAAPEDDMRQAAEAKEEGHGALQGIRKVLTNRIVLCVLATKLTTSVGNSIDGAARPLILKNNFELKEAGLGFAMSLGMACNALSGAFVVGALTRWLSTANVITLCLAGMCLGHFGALLVAPGAPIHDGFMQFASTGIHPATPYLVFSIGGSVFGFVMATVLTSVSTSAVPDDCKGSLMGIEHGMFSLARVGTPAFGTYLLATHGMESVSTCCGSFVAVALAGWHFYGASQVLRHIPTGITKESKKD